LHKQQLLTPQLEQLPHSPTGSVILGHKNRSIALLTSHSRVGEKIVDMTTTHSAYDDCVYPLVFCQATDPPAVFTSYGCAQAIRDIVYVLPFIFPYFLYSRFVYIPSKLITFRFLTAADLYIYQLASSVFCDGAQLLPTDVTVTGFVASTPTPLPT
jgi:hypothetical protein